MQTEADVGVPEDIAHFYFVQLISGLSWMHGKGIAHRGTQYSAVYSLGSIVIHYRSQA